MATIKWNIGQTVEVQSRTWAGINREGGCGRITNIHYAEDGTHVEALDVKYVLSGCVDKNIDPAIVSPFETLQRGGRKRRGRDFLMELDPQPDKSKKNAGEEKRGKTATTATMAKSIPTIHTQTQDKENTLNAASEIPIGPSPARSVESSLSTPERKSKAKKVTPIPSYVIANRKIQVSPLPIHERPRTKTAVKPAVARRGLFENTDATSAQREKSKSRIVPPNESSVPPVPSTPRVSKVEVAMVTAKDDKKVEDSLSDGDHLKIARRKPTVSEKKAPPPKPILEFPRQKRAHKTPHFTSNKPLKEVYDEEVKKAGNFVDDVVGTRKKDAVAESSAVNDMERLKKAMPDERYQEFLAVFRVLRMKAEDGTIEESHFRRLVNEKSTTSPFSDDEINRNLEKLCDDGKVMRSSGTLYIID